MTAILADHPSPDLFLQACGVCTPFRLDIVQRDRQKETSKSFPLPFALIGRAVQSDLTLNHDEVSHRHAYLQVLEGRILCLDLQSRTGTHWQNGPRRCSWLGPEESIRIGPFTLCPRGAADEDAPALAEHHNPLLRAAALDGLPRARLEFLNGVTAQRSWPLTPILTLVGQAPACQIRLRGPSVSRFHCSLVRTSSGLWVIDLLGRGGVVVNNQRVRWARLDDGDQLVIGRFKTRVHYDDAPVLALNSLTSPWQTMNGGWKPASGSLVPAPRPAGALQRSEPLVWHLVDQFSQMQQHMFEQFQQATLMMVQMFASLHKDQFALIQQELERLHELSEELQAIQRELRRHGGVAPAAAEPPPPIRSLIEQQPLGPAAPAHDANGQAHVPPPAAEATSAASPPPPVAVAAAIPVPGASAGAPVHAPPAPSIPSDQSEADVHRWLSERFAAIEKERQSRWQRILGFLRGKRGDESVP